MHDISTRAIAKENQKYERSIVVRKLDSSTPLYAQKGLDELVFDQFKEMFNESTFNPHILALYKQHLDTMAAHFMERRINYLSKNCDIRRVKHSFTVYYQEKGVDELAIFSETVDDWLKADRNRTTFGNMYRIQDCSIEDARKKAFDNPDKLLRKSSFYNLLEKRMPKVKQHIINTDEYLSDAEYQQLIKINPSIWLPQEFSSQPDVYEFIATINTVEFYETNQKLPREKLSMRTKKLGSTATKVAKYAVGLYERFPTDLVAATITVPNIARIYDVYNEIIDQEQSYFKNCEIRADPKGILLSNDEFTRLTAAQKKKYASQFISRVNEDIRRADDGYKPDKSILLSGYWLDIITPRSSMELQVLHDVIKQNVMDNGPLSRHSVHAIHKKITDKKDIEKIGAQRTFAYVNKEFRQLFTL